MDGIGPFFTNMLAKRLHEQKPVTITCNGSPGISKTYTCIQIARHLDPEFDVNQIAMTYSEFLNLHANLGESKCIVLDEPEYEISNRMWFDDRNRAVVASLRSGRYKVHGLFLPSLSKSLLDLVVRKFLIQYQLWCEDRGEVICYSINPSRFDESIMYERICTLHLEMLDSDVCNEETNPEHYRWCLSCDDFAECPTLRAAYERKRVRVQNERFNEDLEMLKKHEVVTYSQEQLQDMATKVRDKIKKSRQGRLVLESLQLVFKQEYNVTLPDHRARMLCKTLDLLWT